MKKLILSLAVLTSSYAFAGGFGVSSTVVESANQFVSANCDYEKADRAFVLEAASVESQRYDQMLYDNYYTMVYGSRSVHSGSVNSNALVLKGTQNWDATEITWSVAAGVCK